MRLPADLRARLLAAARLPALLVAVGLALALVMVWVSEELYDAVVATTGIAALDRPALDLALRLRTPTANTLVTRFTDLGGTTWMPVIAAVATALLARWWRSWTPVVLMLVATAGSLAMTSVGKSAIGRVRPPTIDAVPPFETSPSFPSGHSLNAIVISGLVAYLVVIKAHRVAARRAAVVGAVVFAVAIGLSRVYLGHHWLTDVLVAWALGLGWLAVVVSAHRLWLLRLWRPHAHSG